MPSSRRERTLAAPGGPRRTTLAPVGHLLLALLVTGPAFLPGRLLGSPQADTWNHAWGPWWWWTSLRAGEPPWRTDLLHAPLGGLLWFIDPVLAGLGAPLVPLLGAADAYDLTLTLLLAFGSWAAHRYARALGASWGAAWLASAATVASAWVVCQAHNGISEAANVGPVLLALALGEEAFAQRRTGAWLKAGAAVGFAFVASPYLALGASLALLVRGASQLRQALPGGLLAMAIGAVPLALFKLQLASIDAIVRRPEGMNEQLALHNAVDPRTFVAPLGFRSVDLSAEGMEHSLYLGLVALGLALYALARERRLRPWLVALLVCLVGALGPWLYWGDDWVRAEDGRRLALPWLALQTLVPGLAMTHPLRLGVAALGIVGGLAAVGADRLLGRRAPLLLPLLLLDGLLLSGAPWPVQTAPTAFPEAHALLAQVEPRRDWIVLDLPTDAGQTMATSRYLYWQTAHGRPIPYGPDARASTAVLISEEPFRQLAALSRRRGDEQARLSLVQHSHPALAQLGQVGVRWIFVHEDLDPEPAAELVALLSSSLGPGTRIDATWVWDLGEQVEVRQNHLDQLRAGRAASGPASTPAAPDGARPASP